MATNSVFHNIVVSDRKDAKKFVRALGKAEYIDILRKMTYFPKEDEAKARKNFEKTCKDTGINFLDL